MIEVVAALIRDKNRFLICQRPAHKARAFQWEFPGGKVEPGETKEEAIVRECREELGFELHVDQPVMDVIHQYPDITVHLTLISGTVARGTPRRLEHREIKWIGLEDIPRYSFCPADVAFLERLAEIFPGGNS